jgi:hypothetical protein
MRPNRKGLGLGAAVALLFAALVQPAGAQPNDGSRAEPRAAEETLEALLIVSLKRDLDLDSAAAVELAAKVRPLLEARRSFARQQARLRRELADAVRSPAPDPAHIERLIASVFELRASFVAGQQKGFTEIGAGLDAVHRGRLLVALEQFEDRVRRHLRRFQDAGGRRRGRAAGREEEAEDGDL